MTAATTAAARARTRGRSVPLPSIVVRHPAKVEVTDLRTFRVRQIDLEKLGAFLRLVREDTPSESGDGSLSRSELSELINKTARLNRERPISIGIVARIEDGLNILGGHFLRIRQILRALDLRVSVVNRRDVKLTYDF